MRWIRIGVVCVSILLVAIAVFVVMLFTMDLGRFKTQAETLVSSQLGREFQIQGSFHASLGEEIRLVAEDIRLDNPDWATEKSLVRAHRLDISLNTWALITGRILIENIELDDVAIHLEQDATGLNNWTLFEADPAEETDETESTLDLLIRQARIRDLTVTYADPAQESPIRFQASSIDQVQLESGDLQLELDGDINGTPVALDGTAGSFANLIDAGQVHYDLRGAIGEISINSNAQIDNLAEPRKPVGQLEVSGPNAKYLTDVLGIAPVTRGPLNLVATIEPIGDKMNLLIQGNFGEFEIDVVGSFSDLQELDEVNIDFRTEGPNAATFGELTGLDNIPADPYSIRGTVSRKGDAIAVESVAIEIGQTEFDLSATIAEFPEIDGAVVSLELDGPEFGRFNKLLGLPGKLTGPFSLTADLSQSAEGRELVDITAEAKDIQFRVNGMVSTEPDFVGTELAFSLEGGDLSVITGALDVQNGPRVPFDVNASVSRSDRGFAINEGIAHLGDDVIQVDGLVGNQPLERDTDLRFQVLGPDLARTLDMAGVELENLPPGSYEAAGRIRRKAEYFDLDDITARLGSTRAQLSGRLGNLTDFQGTDIDITIEGDSLAELAPEINEFSLADVPFNVASNVRLTDDALNVRKLTIRIGAGELRGDISMGMSPMASSGSVEITAKGPNVAEWVPSFSEFVPGTAPFDLTSTMRWQDTHVIVDQISLKLGKGRLNANGEVDIVTDFSRTNLNIDAEVASMSNLARIAGRDLPDEPLTLSAHLIGSGEMLRLEDLRITAAKSDLSGSATYDRQGEIPFVAVDLNSKYLNLVPFLPEEEDSAISESAPPVDNSRVIPDTPIPMELLLQLNAQVDISIGELVLRETTVNDVLLDGSLQDGALRIDKFGVAGQRGTLAGNLELLPTANGPQISAVIDGSRLTLGLTPSSPDAVDLLPSYDVQLKLAGRGATARDVAASLDGTVRLVGGSGQSKGIPAWFMRDVTAEIAGTVNPFNKKEGFTRIECFAVLLRSVDGQVDGQPALVLQTDKLNIISVAFINLATEEIDATFETGARKGLGIGVADFITPFTKISGTMAKPRLTFDAERGGATTATLGLSWMAKKFKNRYFGPKDPCGKSVAEADEEMRQLSGE